MALLKVLGLLDKCISGMVLTGILFSVWQSGGEEKCFGKGCCSGLERCSKRERWWSRWFTVEEECLERFVDALWRALEFL